MHPSEAFDREREKAENYNDNTERRREERSLTSVDSRMRHPPARIERPARKEENLSDGGELQTSHEKGRRAILNQTE